MSASRGAEEGLVHLSPDGPVAAAWWWLRELVEGDAGSAWQSATPELRRSVDRDLLRDHVRLPGGGWAALGAGRAPCPVGVDLEVVDIYERRAVEDSGVDPAASWPLEVDVPDPPAGPLPWLRLLMRRDGATWTVAGLGGERAPASAVPVVGPAG